MVLEALRQSRKGLLPFQRGYFVNHAVTHALQATIYRGR
jgi:hypothetical protein